VTTQTIPLNWPTPPITQNQLRRAHYMAEAAMKRQAIADARSAIRAAKATPMDAAIVRLHYRPGTRRLCDTDGLCPTLKVVLDALVKEGVIPQDNWRHVPESSHRIWRPLPGLPGALWVELEPVEADDAA